jgi:hypothetical protein
MLHESLPTLDAASTSALKESLYEVWNIVQATPDACGIFEISKRLTVQPVDQGTTSNQTIDESKASDIQTSAYPPNAFLTYWAIRSLREFGPFDETFETELGIVEVWLHSVVGREIAKHYANVHERDPQQLAWALCGLLVARDTPLSDRSEGSADLIAAGLRCFFEQQLPSGSWDKGRALFHYPDAGNAYCYIFETLAELIGLALDDRLSYSSDLRRSLSPYLGNLLRARVYLELTKRELSSSPVGLMGWSSGHHPHRTSPESWATATAFRFLQSLRRLIGSETREVAATELHAQRLGSATHRLKDRGRTWDTGIGAAGDVLASLFVHPRSAHPQFAGHIDPDRPLLDRDWARSALLFGPPGTGKSTLARSVALELGWSFIEITSAEFLDQGTDFVSARADAIFRSLLEVDSAVVLFDEIDELIRVRGGNPGMLERFFTTTMLPRLARLWDARKLIFFVNTNSVHQVDPAIRRSQRFDAAIFVMPPSFNVKVNLLDESIRAIPNEQAINAVLDTYGTDADAGAFKPEDTQMAWLAFLRYDQFTRLRSPLITTDDQLKERLTTLGIETYSDWSLVADKKGNPGDHPSSDDQLKSTIDAYRSERACQRVDQGQLRLVQVPSGITLPDWLEPFSEGYAKLKDGSQLTSGVLDGAGKLIQV